MLTLSCATSSAQVVSRNPPRSNRRYHRAEDGKNFTFCVDQQHGDWLFQYARRRFAREKERHLWLIEWQVAINDALAKGSMHDLQQVFHDLQTDAQPSHQKQAWLAQNIHVAVHKAWLAIEGYFCRKRSGYGVIEPICELGFGKSPACIYCDSAMHKPELDLGVGGQDVYDAIRGYSDLISRCARCMNQFKDGWRCVACNGDSKLCLSCGMGQRTSWKLGAWMQIYKESFVQDIQPYISPASHLKKFKEQYYIEFQDTLEQQSAILGKDTMATLGEADGSVGTLEVTSKLRKPTQKKADNILEAALGDEAGVGDDILAVFCGQSQNPVDEITSAITGPTAKPAEAAPNAELGKSGKPDVRVEYNRDSQVTVASNNRLSQSRTNMGDRIYQADAVLHTMRNSIEESQAADEFYKLGKSESGLDRSSGLTTHRNTFLTQDGDGDDQDLDTSFRFGSVSATGQSQKRLIPDEGNDDSAEGKEKGNGISTQTEAKEGKRTEAAEATGTEKDTDDGKKIRDGSKEKPEKPGSKEKPQTPGSKEKPQEDNETKVREAEPEEPKPVDVVKVVSEERSSDEDANNSSIMVTEETSKVTSSPIVSEAKAESGNQQLTDSQRLQSLTDSLERMYPICDGDVSKICGTNPLTWRFTDLSKLYMDEYSRTYADPLEKYVDSNGRIQFARADMQELNEEIRAGDSLGKQQKVQDNQVIDVSKSLALAHRQEALNNIARSDWAFQHGERFRIPGIPIPRDERSIGNSLSKDGGAVIHAFDPIVVDHKLGGIQTLDVLTHKRNRIRPRMNVLRKRSAPRPAPEDLHIDPTSFKHESPMPSLRSKAAGSSRHTSAPTSPVSCSPRDTVYSRSRDLVPMPGQRDLLLEAESRDTTYKRHSSNIKKDMAYATSMRGTANAVSMRPDVSMLVSRKGSWNKSGRGVASRSAKFSRRNMSLAANRYVKDTRMRSVCMTRKSNQGQLCLVRPRESGRSMSLYGQVYGSGRISMKPPVPPTTTKFVPGRSMASSIGKEVLQERLMIDPSSLLMYSQRQSLYTGWQPNSPGDQSILDGLLSEAMSSVARATILPTAGTGAGKTSVQTSTSGPLAAIVSENVNVNKSSDEDASKTGTSPLGESLGMDGVAGVLCQSSTLDPRPSPVTDLSAMNATGMTVSTVKEAVRNKLGQSMGNLGKSTGNLGKPTNKFGKHTGKPGKSKLIRAKTVGSLSRMTDNLHKSTDDLHKSNGDLHKSADDLYKSTDKLAQATDNLAQATEDSGKSTENSGKSTHNPEKSIDNWGKSTEALLTKFVAVETEAGSLQATQMSWMKALSGSSERQGGSLNSTAGDGGFRKFSKTRNALADSAELVMSSTSRSDENYREIMSSTSSSSSDTKYFCKSITHKGEAVAVLTPDKLDQTVSSSRSFRFRGFRNYCAHRKATKSSSRDPPKSRATLPGFFSKKRRKNKQEEEEKKRSSASMGDLHGTSAKSKKGRPSPKSVRPASAKSQRPASAPKIPRFASATANKLKASPLQAAKDTIANILEKRKKKQERPFMSIRVNNREPDDEEEVCSSVNTSLSPYGSFSPFGTRGPRAFTGKMLSPRVRRTTMLSPGRSAIMSPKAKMDIIVEETKSFYAGRSMHDAKILSPKSPAMHRSISPGKLQKQQERERERSRSPSPTTLAKKKLCIANARDPAIWLKTLVAPEGKVARKGGNLTAYLQLAKDSDWGTDTSAKIAKITTEGLSSASLIVFIDMSKHMIHHNPAVFDTTKGQKRGKPKLGPSSRHDKLVETMKNLSREDRERIEEVRLEAACYSPTGTYKQNAQVVDDANTGVNHDNGVHTHHNGVNPYHVPHETGMVDLARIFWGEQFTKSCMVGMFPEQQEAIKHMQEIAQHQVRMQQQIVDEIRHLPGNRPQGMDFGGLTRLRRTVAAGTRASKSERHCIIHHFRNADKRERQEDTVKKHFWNPLRPRAPEDFKFDHTLPRLPDKRCNEIQNALGVDIRSMLASSVGKTYTVGKARSSWRFDAVGARKTRDEVNKFTMNF